MLYHYHCLFFMVHPIGVLCPSLMLSQHCRGTVLFGNGKNFIPFREYANMTRQYFLPSQGISSIKSAITWSNGLSGCECAAKGRVTIFYPSPTVADETRWAWRVWAGAGWDFILIGQVRASSGWEKKKGFLFRAKHYLHRDCTVHICKMKTVDIRTQQAQQCVISVICSADLSTERWVYYSGVLCTLQSLSVSPLSLSLTLTPRCQCISAALT